MLRLEIGTTIGRHRPLSLPIQTDLVSRRHHALATSDCFVAMQSSRARPDDGSINAHVALVWVTHHACAPRATAPRVAVDLVRALAASLSCDAVNPMLISSADASFARLLPHIEVIHVMRTQPATVAAHQTRTKTPAGPERPQSELGIDTSEKRSESGTSTAVVASVSDFLGTGVALDAPLMSVGLDSIGATELVRTLGDRLQVELPTTLFFDHPSISAVVEFVNSLK